MIQSDQIRVSVAMAVYNSEKYIKPQIDSIIKQLGNNDELVISYNDSIDNTWNIINEYANQDNRVKIFKCDEKGLLPNFNSAISHSRGKIIFLSDHDDIWLDKKVEKVIDVFEKENSILVLHGRFVVDADLNVIKEVTYQNFKPKFFRNLIKNSFLGAGMAFKSEMKKYICPIPQKNIYHDAWIGLWCSLLGKVSIINEPLMLYRRHEGNLSVTVRRKFYIILLERFSTLVEIIKRLFVIFFVRKL